MLGDDPTHGPRHRVRVFVDFWNYTLSIRGLEASFGADLLELGPALSQATANEPRRGL